MNQPWVYMCSPAWTPLPPPSPSHPSGLSQCTGPELMHRTWTGWRSVSHMVIYMFQCYSLTSSHPHLLPQSPNVCSLHLCLFCCLTYKVITLLITFLTLNLTTFSQGFYLITLHWQALIFSAFFPFFVKFLSLIFLYTELFLWKFFSYIYNMHLYSA